MKPIPRRRLIPIITDLFEYRQAANNTIAYTAKMVEKYGDVCEVSFTGIKNYFIHDPEVIKEILTTQSPNFKRTALFRAFRKFLGEGLFTSDGDYHKRQRRLIKPAFLPKRIEEYADMMVRCANEEIDKWKDGDTININKAMTRITMQVITQTMFGSHLDSRLIDRVTKNMPMAFDVMGRIVQNPLYVYCLEKEIKIPIVKKFFKVKHELNAVINEIILSYRKDEHTGKADLLSCSWKLRKRALE